MSYPPDFGNNLTYSNPLDLDKIPVFIERKNDKDFYLKFFERISPDDFKNKIDLTEKLNSILEKMIRNQPNQWIWSHNRWK